MWWGWAGGGSASGAHPGGDVLLDLEEQRVALITTVTRTFKKHIGPMSKLPDFHTLWLKLVRMRRGPPLHYLPPPTPPLLEALRLGGMDEACSPLTAGFS